MLCLRGGLRLIRGRGRSVIVHAHGGLGLPIEFYFNLSQNGGCRPSGVYWCNKVIMPAAVGSILFRLFLSFLVVLLTCVGSTQQDPTTEFTVLVGVVI